MKKKTQIGLCALSLAVLLSSAASVAAIQSPTDEQLKDLYSLQIMCGDENGDLRLDDNISRAEAVKMVCTAGNITLNEAAPIEDFSDVSPSYWAYRYIAAARQSGIVNGDDIGRFNPEADITNEEIVKLLVALLGYYPMAETRGGYPAGFTATGTQIGLTANLQLPVNTPALRRDVALMFSRALDIPMLIEKIEERKTEDNVDYIIADGQDGSPKQTLRDILQTNR